MCVAQDPTRYLEAALAAGILFNAAGVERGGRGYDGISTHVMLVKPSLDLFTMLASKVTEP